MAASSWVSHRSACERWLPHISADGCRDKHTAGRSGRPKSWQRPWLSNCTQATPAGLPSGMPGIAVLMDGAMQQAAQPRRQAGAAGGRGRWMGAGRVDMG